MLLFSFGKQSIPNPRMTRRGRVYYSLDNPRSPKGALQGKQSAILYCHLRPLVLKALFFKLPILSCPLHMLFLIKLLLTIKARFKTSVFLKNAFLLITLVTFKAHH